MGFLKSAKYGLGIAALACLLLMVYEGRVRDKKRVEATAQLKATCDKLTQEDTEGRVYEPIVGRYLGSKSQIWNVAGVSKSMTHKMIFATDSGEIPVYTGTHIDLLQDYFAKITPILGKDAVEMKGDTTNTFGLCAFLNNADWHVGEVETLRKISD